MSNKIGDEIYDLLAANGFSYKRDNGKHEIWHDGQQTFTLPRGTVKSNRMQDFLRSEIRKKCKTAKREFIDLRYQHNTKKEKVVQFNTPRLELEEIKKPTQATRKHLDKDALEFCKKAREDNWTQRRMADALRDLGYYQANGNPYSQGDISKFMINNGARTLEKRKIRSDKKEVIQQSAPVTLTKVETVSLPSNKKLISDLTEIITCPMSDDLKAKFIKQYFGLS